MELQDHERKVIARLLRGRRTVSQSSLSTVLEPDHAEVLEAIESARWAPNHHRTEPWRFYILDPDRIARLGEMWADILSRRGSAPARVERKRSEWGASKGVVALTCTSEAAADPITTREDYAACCCAAQNFLLHLWSAGIGAKWSTAAVDEHEGFWSMLGHSQRPAGTILVGTFFYGVATRIPTGHRHRSVDEITVDFRRV